MRMAIRDGEVLLADLGDSYMHFREIASMKWDKTSRVLKGPADYETLLALSQIFRLPDAYQKYFDGLKAQRRLIEEQRSCDDPEPIADYPVKVKLYKHQIRAANMALMTFGVMPERGDQNH